LAKTKKRIIKISIVGDILKIAELLDKLGFKVRSQESGGASAVIRVSLIEEPLFNKGFPN
jgi:hypothetical protein